MTYRELLDSNKKMTVREFREHLIMLDLREYRAQILITPLRGFRAVGTFVLRSLIRQEISQDFIEDDLGHPDLNKYSKALSEMNKNQSEIIKKFVKENNVKDSDLSRSLKPNFPALRICKF